MGQKTVPIKDFRPMMRGFDCEFIVLECSTPNKVRDGSVIYKFKVADSSGSIILNVWGNDGQYIKNGDILRVEGAEARLFKNVLQVSITRYGKIKKLGENNMEFKEFPNFSDFQWVSEEEKVRIDAEANKNILSSLKAGAGVSNSTE